MIVYLLDNGMDVSHIQKYIYFFDRIANVSNYNLSKNPSVAMNRFGT